MTSCSVINLHGAILQLAVIQATTNFHYYFGLLVGQGVQGGAVPPPNDSNICHVILSIIFAKYVYYIIILNFYRLEKIKKNFFAIYERKKLKKTRKSQKSVKKVHFSSSQNKRNHLWGNPSRVLPTFTKRLGLAPQAKKSGKIDAPYQAVSQRNSILRRHKSLLQNLNH